MKTLLLNFLGFTIIGLIVLITGCVYYLSLQRETKNWQENVEVTKNIMIPIDFMASNKVYYGGHGFGWGGGDDRDSFKYKFKGVDYFHETPFTPIVMKLYQGNFYIIYFDRTNMHKIIFRFFKSSKDGTFKEIKPKLFPKSIAIQNRWLKDGDLKVLKDMIVKNRSEFSSSLTAKIWQQLDVGKPYFESNYNVPKELIQNYKEKYIK